MQPIVNINHYLIELFTSDASSLGKMLVQILKDQELTPVSIRNIDTLPVRDKALLREDVRGVCIRKRRPICDVDPTLYVWFDDSPMVIPNHGATGPDAMIKELVYFLALD